MNISIGDFFDLLLVIPSLAEQKQIACLLNATNRELELLEEKLLALRTQKKGLMQKLLTGRVRVTV